MLTINKITSDHVVDFAAEELKKYFRMMMPRIGEIPIRYAPEAKDGFRLGVMADFGLSTAEAEDTELDDILHIDTTAEGGIIAGSNPRSVLLAVYRFLRENGCRWLFPGVDGERIPMKNVEGVQFHKMADMRYRGQCNEGAESQQCVLDAIDFTPKLGMNAFMLEFDIPMTYYEKYYNHSNNPNREKEPVSADTVLQWKRACETEIAKRGLQFHDMGHGWTAEAFGISSIGGWTQDPENHIPEENRQYLAMMNGKRGLCNGVALNTNFCMSNPAARKKVVDLVVDYARKSTNVDYLHVWLADWQKNHCECDECRKMIPSDWYVVLANDIDEALTAEKLNTRIGLCAYSDTAWDPEQMRLKNPSRFIANMGAITRSYCRSVEKDPVPEKLTPYIRNVTPRIATLEEYVYRAHNWMKMAGCNFFVYEYHFWKAQFECPSPLPLARRLYEDVRAYHDNRFVGIIEDGSQRSFFPNGLPFTVYAATLFDLNTDYEKTVDDYLSCAYGPARDIVAKFFTEFAGAFRQEYVEYIHSKPVNPEHYRDPSEIPNLERAIALCDGLDRDLAGFRNLPYRTQTVAVRLLGYYTEFWRGMARAFILKAQGKDDEAKKAFTEFLNEFGKKELEIERYYDQHLAGATLRSVFSAGAQVQQ